MIDTHAHIYLKQFAGDLNQTIDRSRDSGVLQILMPNVDHTTIDAMLESEHNYDGYCLAMMGLHPCSVNKHFEKELYLVEEWLDKRPFVAVGEMGTDLYWDTSTFRYQQEAFRIQVGFTGTDEQAQRIISMGFKLGIGGVVTFKNSGLDTTLGEVEIEHLVLETDSPYLAPVPYRGKRNEPAYLSKIVDKLSEIYSKAEEEIDEITTNKAKKLFKLDRWNLT